MSSRAVIKSLLLRDTDWSATWRLKKHMQAVQLYHILYIPKNSATSYIIETLFNSIFITEPFMWQNNRLIYLFIINTYFFQGCCCYASTHERCFWLEEEINCNKTSVTKIIVTENNPYNSLQCKSRVKISLGERREGALGALEGGGGWGRGNSEMVEHSCVIFSYLSVIQTKRLRVCGSVFTRYMLEECNVIFLLTHWHGKGS